MKRIIILFSAVLLMLKTQAQDIIVKISGDEIKVKVTEITLNDIVYKHPDSLSGQPRTIAKKEVFMIKYANGTKEVIAQAEVTEIAAVINESPQAMYNRGRTDARKNYKPKGVFWGSAASGFGAFFTYGAALAVPVAIAATPPKISGKEIPDKSLLASRDYMQGYRKQAQNKKAGKAAAGTLTGVGITLGAAVLVVVSVLSNMQ